MRRRTLLLTLPALLAAASASADTAAAATADADAGAPRPLRYPLLLAHGFNASPTSPWGFNPDLLLALAEDGHRTAVSRVSPFGSIAERAAQLAPQADRLLRDHAATHGDPRPRINIVAHSMGGLDARFLISRLGFGARVASLTTIGTPHRGTRIADDLLVTLALLDDDLVRELARALADGYAGAGPEVTPGDPRAALRDLSEAAAAEFNRRTPDHPAVYYQSWAGLSNLLGIPGPYDAIACSADGATMFTTPRDWMDSRLQTVAWSVAHGAQLRPNDGVVTVDSARWGHFRGCLPADHLDQIGQVGDVGADPVSGFDYLRFYRGLAAELAIQGF